MVSQASFRSVSGATVAALASLLAWWGGVRRLDGALAAGLPYHRYETAALLYPDVFYPGLPGWALAAVQPSAVGVWATLLGWIVLLSVGIGAGSVRYADRRDRSPALVAAMVVLATFVVATVGEAVATFVA